MVGIDYLYKWSIGSLDLTIVKGKYQNIFILMWGYHALIGMYIINCVAPWIS